ncbi:MAG: hypothetical protein WBL58_10145 [Peptococcia bacterium]|jgi:group I intron endonuclease
MAVTGIIYRRFIVNDKGVEISYVGQTCDPIKRHNDFLNPNVTYSGIRIENARKKYGPERFEYEVLETITCESNEDLATTLNEREIFWIAEFNSFNKGYNNSIGGGGASGYRHTEEYKQWQSKHSKKINKDPIIKRRQKEGMLAYFKSPGAREKRSAELLKRYEDPYEREKLSVAQKKSYADNPLRAKLRNAKLSNICSTPEGRKRMSDTIKNAWKSPVYRKKYSKSKKALWATEEYRAKMAVSLKNINGKRVRQLTLDGVFIKDYPSATEAAKAVKGSFGSVARVCRGERPKYKNFRWEYINND